YIAPTLMSDSGESLSTVITPQAANWLATIDSVQAGQVVLNVSPALLPVGARNPVSLKITPPRASFHPRPGPPLFARGDVVDGKGSVIQVDPRGTVALAGDTVEVDGKISAPAGSIDLKGGAAFTGNGFAPPEEALPTVVLGAGSELSSVGVILPAA